MGAPKSGTTWLQTIMNAHPQVSCFGEGHYVEQIVLPMQALLRHYNRKLTVVADAVYSGAPAYSPVGGEDAAVLIRHLVLGMIRRAKPKPQAIWWGDKTPAYSRHLPELDRLFPQSRFIDIVRDPRDVAVSTLYHAARAGALTDIRNDTVRRRELIAHAMSRWTEHRANIARAAEPLGPRLLQVHYEELVTDPEPQLRRLYRHLEGVRVTDEILAATMAACSFAAMSGGRQPGETDDRSFFRSGTTGQHETELTDPERTQIAEALAGE